MEKKYKLFGSFSIKVNSLRVPAPLISKRAGYSAGKKTITQSKAFYEQFRYLL